jgi:hypothetical protein
MEIYANENYSLVKSRSGIIYSSGMNNFQQLGVPNLNSVNYFVPFLSKNLASKLYPSRYYAVITTSTLLQCNGVPQNEPNVCSQNGICYNSICECYPNYYGNNCNLTTCFGVYSNDTNVCSGKGTCVSLNTCKCNINVVGENCDQFTCFGVPSNNTNVCNENGKCINADNCKCNQNVIGEKCNDCVQGYTYSSGCKNYSCFGIQSNSIDVCNGNGICTGPNKCECIKNVIGDRCDKCTDGYINPSTKCVEFTCFGIPVNGSNVCNGNGECKNLDNCKCSQNVIGEKCNDCVEGYTYSSGCKNYSCFGVESNSIDVCNGNGICASPNKCVCGKNVIGEKCDKCDVGYIDPSTKCLEFTCFDIPAKSSSVCSGNGVCASPDKCVCEKNVIGDRCDKCTDGYIDPSSKCLEFTCFGIPSKSKDVCNGHGECFEIDKCKCKQNVQGLRCDDCIDGYTYSSGCKNYSCFGIPNNSTYACGGNGECKSPNVCQCFSGIYSGDQCNQVSSSFAIPFVFLMVIILIFISCMILLAALACIGCLTFRYFQNKKKFIFKNNELKEKLALIQGLNKIPFGSITFNKNRNGTLRVIGKGATSTVYSGTYEGNKIAAKEVSIGGDMEDSLLTELYMLKILNHKNIIKYYGFSIDYVGNIFIITELLEKGDLSDYIQRSNLSIIEKYKLIYEISDGISYMHSLSTPIIHRDLKTPNILLSDDYSPKISDFGISKYSNEKLGKNLNLSKEL